MPRRIREKHFQGKKKNISEYKELKEKIRESIQKRRSKGWYFTTDLECPECGNRLYCKEHKWEYLTFRVGLEVTVEGGIPEENPKHHEIRDKIASQLSEELEIE